MLSTYRNKHIAPRDRAGTSASMSAPYEGVELCLSRNGSRNQQSLAIELCVRTWRASRNSEGSPDCSNGVRRKKSISGSLWCTKTDAFLRWDRRQCPSHAPCGACSPPENHPTSLKVTAVAHCGDFAYTVVDIRQSLSCLSYPFPHLRYRVTTARLPTRYTPRCRSVNASHSVYSVIAVCLSVAQPWPTFSHTCNRIGPSPLLAFCKRAANFRAS
jgi:hypothetical protein